VVIATNDVDRHWYSSEACCTTLQKWSASPGGNMAALLARLVAVLLHVASDLLWNLGQHLLGQVILHELRSNVTAVNELTERNKLQFTAQLFTCKLTQ
jgi:hypothetical protein